MCPAYVQQQLGHSEVSLTVRVYGSHFPVGVPGAVDAVAAAFTGSLAGHPMDASVEVGLRWAANSRLFRLSCVWWSAQCTYWK